MRVWGSAGRLSWRLSRPCRRGLAPQRLGLAQSHCRQTGQGAFGRAVHPLSQRQFGHWLVPQFVDRHRGRRMLGQWRRGRVSRIDLHDRLCCRRRCTSGHGAAAEWVETAGADQFARQLVPDDLLGHAGELDQRVEIDPGPDAHLLAKQNKLPGAVGWAVVRSRGNQRQPATSATRMCHSPGSQGRQRRLLAAPYGKIQP